MTFNVGDRVQWTGTLRIYSKRKEGTIIRPGRGRNRWIVAWDGLDESGDFGTPSGYMKLVSSAPDPTEGMFV